MSIEGGMAALSLATRLRPWKFALLSAIPRGAENEKGLFFLRCPGNFPGAMLQKRTKKVEEGEKGRFRRISWKGGQTP